MQMFTFCTWKFQENSVKNSTNKSHYAVSSTLSNIPMPFHSFFFLPRMSELGNEERILHKETGTLLKPGNHLLVFRGVFMDAIFRKHMSIKQTTLKKFQHLE